MNRLPLLPWLFLFHVLGLPLSAQRGNEVPTDEQVREMVPEGVAFWPDLSYREGHERWKLDLFLPEVEGDALRPALVFIHGGGWRNGDKRRDAFLKPAIAYAAKGYITLSVNYRLTPDRSEVNHCVADVKNAVRWLRAHAGDYHVDPNRIGATGNSAGAHLSVMLGVCPPEAGLEGEGPYQGYSSRVQAVVASATPTQLGMTTNVTRELSEAQRQYLTKVSPATYVSAEAPPVLLFHEQSDRTVQVMHSDTFVAALREAGARDVNYVLLGDGSGHGVFGRNLGILEPMREAFFDRVLRGK